MLSLCLTVDGVERFFDVLWFHRSEATKRPRRRGRSVCSIRENRADGAKPVVAMGLSECGPKDVFRKDVGREVSTKRAAAFLATWLGDASVEAQVMEQFYAKFPPRPAKQEREVMKVAIGDLCKGLLDGVDIDTLRERWKGHGVHEDSVRRLRNFGCY